MQKRKLLIIGGLSTILIVILGILLFNYIRLKTAKVEIVLSKYLETEFLSDVTVSTFIESINGHIVDDYKIDTKTIGKKEIKFSFINEDGIKINYKFNIEVVDKIAPLVWLNKSYSIKLGSEDDLTSKILCGDNYDDTPECKIVGDYDLNEEGNYDLVFEATDSSGNKTIKNFTLNVYEPKPANNVNQGSTRKKIQTEFSDVVRNYKNDYTEVGIDVSKWQGDIDFAKLKDAGVEFVIIRVGSAEGIDGDYYLDSKFLQNIKKANMVGIPVGLYYYSYANSKERAIEDAKWLIENIKDYKIDLPIAFDWEDWNNFNAYNLSFYNLTQIANSYLDTIKSAGYEGMLYSSKNYLENIWMEVNYPIWLAHYTKKTSYEGYSYWQICNNGKVEGINGNVDINIRLKNLG